MDSLVDDLMVLLPGGYIDPNDMVHQTVALAPLTGREEEWLAGRPHHEIAALITTILSQCIRRIGAVSPVSEAVIRDLLVADRQYLLLRLRAATLGDHIRATILCPWQDCGKKITVAFSVHDVPVKLAASHERVHTMQLSSAAVAGIGHAAISFRLPNGGDQEAIVPILEADEQQAIDLLFQRCIQRIGPLHNPDADVISRLSPLARMEIEQQMEAIAPKVDLTMESQCPECGREYAVPFDIERFFLNELRTSRDRLYREVHYLAYHYHWSEREIMGMPRLRRHAYIEVLAAEIERLNNGD